MEDPNWNPGEGSSEVVEVKDEVNRIGLLVPLTVPGTRRRKKEDLQKPGEQINSRNGLLRQNYILNGNRASHHHLLNGQPQIFAVNAAKHNWHSYNSPGTGEGNGDGAAAFEFETKIKIRLDTQGYSLTLFLFSQIIVLAMFLFSGVF